MRSRLAIAVTAMLAVVIASLCLSGMDPPAAYTYVLGGTNADQVSFISNAGWMLFFTGFIQLMFPFLCNGHEFHSSSYYLQARSRLAILQSTVILSLVISTAYTALQAMIAIILLGAFKTDWSVKDMADLLSIFCFLGFGCIIVSTVVSSLSQFLRPRALLGVAYGFVIVGMIPLFIAYSHLFPWWQSVTVRHSAYVAENADFTLAYSAVYTGVVVVVLSLVSAMLARSRDILQVDDKW